MDVIPGVDAATREEVMAQLERAASLSSIIHMDVCDGKFTKALTWGGPEDFKVLIETNKVFKNKAFEIHLMVENPEVVMQEWLNAGARRFIVHEEAIRDFGYLQRTAKNHNAILLLSVDMKRGQLSYEANLFDNFQVLAVPPGFAGQEFDERAIDKIRLLRQKYPDAKIEVDGGINPETAKLVKAAGANTVISTSYLQKSADPAKAYKELKEIK